MAWSSARNKSFEILQTIVPQVSTDLFMPAATSIESEYANAALTCRQSCSSAKVLFFVQVV
jgi:hypothetical protein